MMADPNGQRRRERGSAAATTRVWGVNSPSSPENGVSMTLSVEQRIAEELGVQLWQVTAAIGLLDDGATVPFVARYRKEVTGTLDDTQLRTLLERLGYLRELDKRRIAILDSIRGQGKLRCRSERISTIG